ncbi:MAG: efflux RND transporter periplasmic adaptor subunit [Rhodospirillaceae bacterium]
MHRYSRTGAMARGGRRARAAGAGVDAASRALRRIRAAFLVAGVAALAAAAMACANGGGEEEIVSSDEPTIAAEVGTVTRRDLVEALIVPGTVVAMPNQDVKVAALVAGRVDSLSVAEGDWVKAGQTVAVIDARPFADQRRQAAAAVSQAKAAVENARLNLERTDRLFQRGIAAGKEVEDARAQRAVADAELEQASAALDTADLQLARTRVTSPIAGQIVKRLVSVGEQVDGTAAQPIVEVANLDHVEIAAAIPAEHLGRVKVGQRAAVSSDAYAGRTFDGEIIAIAPAVDSATNTALARIRLVNTDRLLKVGMFAQAGIGVSERTGALTVPPSAVSKSGSEAAVYAVSGDLATRTNVTLGLETSDAVEITSGVTEGQKVLTSAIHGLGERARLAPPK